MHLVVLIWLIGLIRPFLVNVRVIVLMAEIVTVAIIVHLAAHKQAIVVMANVPPTVPMAEIAILQTIARPVAHKHISNRIVFCLRRRIISKTSIVDC